MRPRTEVTGARLGVSRLEQLPVVPSHSWLNTVMASVTAASRYPHPESSTRGHLKDYSIQPSPSTPLWSPVMVHQDSDGVFRCDGISRYGSVTQSV